MLRRNGPRAEHPVCCSFLPAAGTACGRAQEGTLLPVSSPGTAAESTGQGRPSPKQAAILAVGRGKEKPPRPRRADLPACSLRCCMAAGEARGPGARWMLIPPEASILKLS